MQVWPNVQEKVLAVKESWHNNHSGTHLRLRLALMDAGQWLVDPANKLQTIEALPQQLPGSAA